MVKKIFVFIIVLITVGIIAFIIGFNSDKTDKLAGLWDVDGNTKYEFDGKGNGKIIVPLSEYEFTYIIKENVVSIYFKNKESTNTKYEFKILKNNLELKDLNQQSINLKLKRIEK